MHPVLYKYFPKKIVKKKRKKYKTETLHKWLVILYPICERLSVSNNMTHEFEIKENINVSANNTELNFYYLFLL